MSAVCSLRSKTDGCSRTLTSDSKPSEAADTSVCLRVVMVTSQFHSTYFARHSVLLQVLSCFLLAKELARLGIIRDDESSSNRIYAP